MIAALYVEPKGCYAGLEGVDLWGPGRKVVCGAARGQKRRRDPEAYDAWDARIVWDTQ